MIFATLWAYYTPDIREVAKQDFTQAKTMITGWEIVSELKADIADASKRKTNTTINEDKVEDLLHG